MNERMKAKVYVTLKREVLDPQGDAVRRALQSLGHSSVDRVRVGKFVELELDATDSAAAKIEVERMCEALLANPVIEDYRIECD